jgi:hypothetical protein
MISNRRNASETSPAPHDERSTLVEVTFGEVPCAVFVVESELESHAHRRVVRVSVARSATFNLP